MCGALAEMNKKQIKDLNEAIIFLVFFSTISLFPYPKVWNVMVGVLLFLKLDKGELIFLNDMYNSFFDF